MVTALYPVHLAITAFALTRADIKLAIFAIMRFYSIYHVILS